MSTKQKIAGSNPAVEAELLTELNKVGNLIITALGGICLVICVETALNEFYPDGKVLKITKVMIITNGIARLDGIFNLIVSDIVIDCEGRISPVS